MLDTIWKPITFPPAVKDLSPRDQNIPIGTCISGALLNQIPACALGCIQDFVDTNYAGSTCAERSDLNFLCTQSTTSGLSVGEGAVQCIASSCPITDLTNLGVFNICDNIQGAIPETLGTLTVTISDPQTSTSPIMTTTYPASIGVPSSTPVLSTFIIATSSPTPASNTSQLPSTFVTTASPVATTSSMTTTSSLTSSSTAQGSAGASSSQSIHTVTTGLTAAQIAGIIVAGVATSALIFGILAFIFCLRSRRKARRRSARFSMMEKSNLPPRPSLDREVAEKVQRQGTTPLGSSQRFYASPATQQQPRRSFWRKSIKPEDIGVAVSPNALNQPSPASIGSHQSSSRLLPATLVHPALRPEPLRFGTGGGITLRVLRPASDATITVPYEEKAAGRFTPPSFQNNMMERSSLRSKAVPPPLTLKTAQSTNNVTPKKTSSPQSGRVALTPVYDNGHFMPSDTKPSVAPIRGMNARPETQRQTDSNVANKYDFINTPFEDQQKQVNTQNLPLATPSSTYTDDLQRRSAATRNRPYSVASSVTDFEDEVTPEHEMQKARGNRQVPNTSPTVASSMTDPTRPNSPTSPIRDLRYPKIPRPAAVTRQAERAPVPRPVKKLRPVGPITPPASRLDQLIRAEASFIRTDTSSTTASALPDPPQAAQEGVVGTLAPPRGRTSNLKLRPYTTNLGRKLEATPQSIPSNATPRSILKNAQVNVPPQRSPSSKMRLTPSRSNTGDLYLTVE